MNSIAPRILLTMELSGPIPFRAANAYGVAPRAVPAAPTITPPAQTVATPNQRIDTFEPSGVAKTNTQADGISKLIGGTVRSDINRGVGFDEIQENMPEASPPRSGDTIPLYGKSADLMAAATRLSVGNNLDVKG